MNRTDFIDFTAEIVGGQQIAGHSLVLVAWLLIAKVSFGADMLHAQAFFLHDFRDIEHSVCCACQGLFVFSDILSLAMQVSRIDLRGNSETLEALHYFLILVVDALGLLLLRDEVEGSLMVKRAHSVSNHATATLVKFKECLL